MFLVANFCHYNENFKNGKHLLETNARPSGAAPTNSRHLGKSLDAKAPGWGQIFDSNPRGCAGGMDMDEIDTCITDFRSISETKDW